jgi:Gpi18-like mannosyltransferase
MKRAAIRDIIYLFTASRAAFLMITYFGYILLTQPKYSSIAVGFGPLVDAWNHWDAANYTRIAQHGYLSLNHPFDPAFFPLFPLLMRIAAWPFGNQGHLILGIVISNLAFLGALFVVYQIAEDALGEQVGRRTLLYLCLFPTAFYFFAPYTESLFLALTAGSFLAMRRRRWLLAAILGFFAAMTRNAGVLLVIPYLYEVWFAREQSSLRFKELPGVIWHLLPRLLPVVLIPLGVVIYMYYCWKISGDPLRFAAVQGHWGRFTTWPFVGIWRNLVEIFWTQPFTSSNTPHSILDLSATLGFIALTVAGWRKLRTSYTLWMVLLSFTALIAPATGALADPLQSNQRFVLVMFPGFITLAALALKYPRLHQALIFFFPLLLATCTILFIMNRWMV